MNTLERLSELIVILARRRRLEGERSFAAFRLNHTQARLITLINQNGGSAGQDAVSSLVHVDRSNVGRAIKHLEQLKLIDRTRDEQNKKTYIVALTEKGKAMAKELGGTRLTVARAILGSLTEEEVATATRILEKAAASDSLLDDPSGERAE